MPDEDKAPSGDTVASISGPLSPALTPTLPAPGIAGGSPLPAIAHDRYQLADEIGRGGIGRVLRAHDTVLGRQIAIKELRDDEDDGARRRFVREAMITARLQHPAIVPIYEAGRRGDAPFYSMKLVSGKTLADAIAKAGELANRLALLPNVLAVADAMAFAHRERIIHRDLKPGNVLLGEFGETVVIDWGLAKDLGIDDRDAGDAGPYRSSEPQLHDTDRTVAGVVLGTPAYMAPEQAKGSDVDERADVYAIGAMLYHVVSGAMPHEGDTQDEMIERIVRGDIVPVTEREPDVPPDLATIINKAMARDPAARYPTARELADDLRRYQTGQLVASHRYTFGERLARWVRRYRSLLAVATIGTLALLVYGGWSMREIANERDTAVEQRNVAAENKNKVVLAHARTALERDPAEALAWLATLDAKTDEGWKAARAIAGEAWARPRSDRIVRDAPRSGFLEVSPGGLAVVATSRTVYVHDLETGRSDTYAVATDHVLARPCDDGTRIVGFGSHAGSPPGTYTITQAKHEVTSVKPSTWYDTKRELAECTVQHRFYADATELRSWDPATRTHQKNGPYEAARWIGVTLDGRHAIVPQTSGTLVRLGIDGSRDEVAWFPPQRNRLSWSRDGGLLVAYSKGIELVDVVAKQTRIFDPDPVDALVVAPDASWLAVARNGTVRILDLAGKVRAYLYRAGKPDQLLVSPDGKWIAAVGAQVVFWEIASPEPHALPAGMGNAQFIDGALLTHNESGQLRRWPLVSAPASPLGGDYVQRAALSTDGRILAYATPSTVVRVIDGNPERVGLHTEPNHLAVADDGAIAIAGTPMGIYRWPRGQGLQRLAHGNMGAPDSNHIGWARGVELSWNGDALGVWKGGAKQDLYTPQEIAAPPVAFRMRLNSAQGHIETMEPTRSSRWRPAAIAVSPDGRWVAASTLYEVRRGYVAPVVLFDLETGRATQLPAAFAEHPAFTPDSRQLVTGNADGALVRWDLATLAPTALGRADLVPAVAAVSRDGTRLALAGAGGAIVAEPGSGRPAIQFALPASVLLYHAAFTGDGNTLVVADRERLYFFDLHSREAWTRDLHVHALAFRGGELVAITSSSVMSLENSLPTDRAAFARWLYQLPYWLDDKNQVHTDLDRQREPR